MFLLNFEDYGSTRNNILDLRHSMGLLHHFLTLQFAQAIVVSHGSAGIARSSRSITGFIKFSVFLSSGINFPVK